MSAELRLVVAKDIVLEILGSGGGGTAPVMVTRLVADVAVGVADATGVDVVLALVVLM